MSFNYWSKIKGYLLFHYIMVFQMVQWEFKKLRVNTSTRYIFEANVTTFFTWFINKIGYELIRTQKFLITICSFKGTYATCVKCIKHMKICIKNEIRTYSGNTIRKIINQYPLLLFTSIFPLALGNLEK